MVRGEIEVAVPKMCPDAASFRSILEHKEKEIVGLCEEQVLSLQQQLCHKEKELAELATRFFQLQDDFKYNLALLDERDAELMEYDASAPLLQASTLEVEERLKEATEALSGAQLQIAQEKQKCLELERQSARELATLRKQMEGLCKDKDDISKQLKLVETQNTDLGHQMRQKQIEFSTKLQELERQYLDRMNKQKLESQAAVDEVSSKCQIVESEVKQLRQSLAEEVQKHKLQHKLELELRGQAVEKDHQIQRLQSEIKQLERELDNIKLDASLEAKHLNDKLEKLEDDYEAQVSQLKGQVACLLRKQEVLQARLKDNETEKYEQLTLCNEKVHKLEQEMLEREKHSKKVEQAEIEWQKALSAQEQRLKESELQCSKWKAECDAAQSQLKMLQETYARDKENLLQATKLSEHYNTKLAKSRTSRQKMDSRRCSPVESWSFDVGLDDISIPEPVEHGLEVENRRLRASVQDAKDENAKLRTAVETMRLEMEDLQNHTLEEGSRSRDALKTKSDEVRNLQEELQSLKAMMTKMATNFQKLEQVGYEKDDKQSDSRLPECNSNLELEKSQAILRAQLEGAIGDIARITNERDLLMELSNSLRADLNRCIGY